MAKAYTRTKARLCLKRLLLLDRTGAPVTGLDHLRPFRYGTGTNVQLPLIVRLLE